MQRRARVQAAGGSPCRAGGHVLSAGRRAAGAVPPTHAADEAPPAASRGPG